MSQADPKRIEHLRARMMADLGPTDAMPGECPGPGELTQRLQQPLQLVDALERWVYVLGTDRVFDLWLLREYPVRHLRYELAGNASMYKEWLTHPARRQVAPEDIVFEPSGHCLPHQINLWRGFPLAPIEGDCGPILELVEHLMSETAPDPEGRARHVEYLLHWLAYPLQHPGAKLRSALVFHGPQGCGKSLLFEGVMARIYGEYARVIGQAQLESKYTDWASRCLFVVADEVLAPGEAAHFGGRPQTLLIDNAKALVDKHDTPTRQVRLNSRFEAFCRHWDIAARACAPFRARTKGKTENGVGYVKNNAIAGHAFESWAAMQAHLARWQREVADVRIHGTTGVTPAERFELERAHLRPIAGIAPFLQVRELVRRVNAEGCIELDTNAYSVPWRLIGETVTVIVSADTVVVEYAGEEVARHAQLRGSRGRSIERSHLLGGSPPPAAIEVPPPTDALLRPLAEYEALVGGGW